jgi:hypothetical protein
MVPLQGGFDGAKPNLKKYSELILLQQIHLDMIVAVLQQVVLKHIIKHLRY